MDRDLVIAPAIVLAISLIVPGLCFRRMRTLGIKGYTKWRRISERIVLSLVVLVAVAAGAGATFNAVATHLYRARHAAPGNLYVVDGYKMHLHCSGEGSPTIVLDAGLGDDSLIWAKVQPELSKTTRVCSYDRAGFGWSDPQPGPHDADRIVQQLHELLIEAGISGSTVLMGHSVAGLYIVLTLPVTRITCPGWYLSMAQHPYRRTASLTSLEKKTRMQNKKCRTRVQETQMA